MIYFYYLLFFFLIIFLFFFKNLNEYFDVKKNLGYLQGVIVDKNFYYLVYSKGILKFNIKTNQFNKSTKYNKNLKHLNGGIIYNNMLYLTNNPKNGKNSLEIFDKELNYITSIKLDKLKGSLTWIDFYKGYFFGLLAYYKDEVKKTRIVKFDNQFNIIKQWKIPKSILNRLYPNSISGGQFNKTSGILFLTGHDKKEIYLMNLNNNLKYIKTLKTSIAGQGISFDKNNDKYLWGIDRKNNKIIKSHI